MANTINQRGFTVQISDVDSDWSWRDTFTDPKYANGIPINFIQFNGVGSSDKCSIKEEDDAGPECFFAQISQANDQRRAYYHGTPIKPVLDFSEGTYTAGSSVTIQLWKDAVH